LGISFLAKDPRNVTNGLVPLAEDLASLVEARDRLAEDPFVLPHDPCLSAADLVFPIEERSSLRRDLFVHAEPRRQHAKALCFLANALCFLTKALCFLTETLGCLSEGLFLFTACGCKESEVLCSPAMALSMLAKDLWQLSEILVPRTTGLLQEAEDHVSSAKGLHQEPKDLHRKPDDVSALAEDICPFARALVQETAVLFRGNKGHSVVAKSGPSRSKHLSQVSTALRLESESLFVNPERLCRQAAERSQRTSLLPLT
jgi:hypothetical protein